MMVYNLGVNKLTLKFIYFWNERLRRGNNRLIKVITFKRRKNKLNLDSEE